MKTEIILKKVGLSEIQARELLDIIEEYAPNAISFIKKLDVSAEIKIELQNKLMLKPQIFIELAEALKLSHPQIRNLKRELGLA